MGFINKIYANTRKPEGRFGEWEVNFMNMGHGAVSEWGRSRFPHFSPSDAVDLGCGGGRNIKELMKKYPFTDFTAFDYSEVSLKKTAELNSGAIACGKLKIQQGDVSSMPFENESFDLATAVETVYFWPGPAKSFSEVYRILRKGGKFIIINETDGMNEKDKKWEDIIENMKIFGIEELTSMLDDAGFSDIQVIRKEKNNWVMFIAVKK